ncbi:MAG: hypothetical protein ACK5AO_04535 [bacterium]
MTFAKLEAMSNWSAYGQWRHPENWWKTQFDKWIALKHPDKLMYNPQIIEITLDDIVFGMNKHMGRLHVSKKTIIEELKLSN